MRTICAASRHAASCQPLQARRRAPACPGRLLNQPSDYVGPLEEALEDMVRNLDPKYLTASSEVKVGFSGRRAAARAGRLLGRCFPLISA